MTDLAKPSGITIEEHVEHLRNQAIPMLAVRPVALRKYEERTKQDLSKSLDDAIWWHNEGKRNSKWQEACRLDYEDFVRSGKDGEPRGVHLQKCEVRHEISSILRAERNKASLSDPIRVAIAAHHRKLSYKEKKRWLGLEAHKELWQSFCRISSCIHPFAPSAFDESVSLRYEYDGPRALLQLVDHRASAEESGSIPEQFVAFSYNFPHRNCDGTPHLRGVQRILSEFQDEEIALLRAPTGAGKTDAALLWASHKLNAEKRIGSYLPCQRVLLPERWRLIQG